MAYNYKYTPASIEAGAKKGINPKNQYIELFQKTLDEQFYNASDWWTIQEETLVGSNLFNEVDVRISHVINAETGLKLGDDWKTVLFPDLNHQLDLGKRYIFNGSVWMVINTEVIKNIAATCTIRRCNNTLRWIDERTGSYYTEPCSIEYEVKEPRDYATQGSPFMTPGGFLKIYTQLNSRTALIKENQRFLFGNRLHWTCYKVVATGLGDFLNMTTYDNDSAHILSMDLAANFVNNETDDIEDGIADAYTNLYNVTLNNTTIQGQVGTTYQLTANVKYNGNSVTRTMDWESSNTKIASVSGSGLVNFLSTGSCIITTSVHRNPAYADCLITVTGSPAYNYEITLSPNKNYVLEGSSQTYEVYLYENNIKASGSFVVTCNSGSISSANYVFTQNTGNTFTISNIKRDVNSFLTIRCTTGSVIPYKDFYIYLRGGWQFDNV